MPRCKSKTLAGRRCKKSGTRNGYCAIHEHVIYIPVAIDPRNSRGRGPALGHQPNQEGPRDGTRPEHIAFMERRAELIRRFHATAPLEMLNQRIGAGGQRGAQAERIAFATLSRDLAMLGATMAPLRNASNQHLSQQIQERMRDIEQRIIDIEERRNEQIRADAERQRVLEAARQRAREVVAEQQRVEEERLARAAQLREDLRLRAVVFRRDPEGSIDLRAFAEDGQSVHRSSVQNTTHKAVIELLSRRPAPPADQDTLPEIVGILNTSQRWPSPEVRDAVITELTDNYFNAIAFSIPYGRVVDFIWAYIRSHAEKIELTQRLTEELSEGRGMCSNGKMARLINVVQGYDESLTIAAPRELFQQRMGELSSKPSKERIAAAHELFAEFRIPEAEHADWLEPLLEA